jgi:hypothetical protein
MPLMANHTLAREKWVDTCRQDNPYVRVLRNGNRQLRTCIVSNSCRHDVLQRLVRSPCESVLLRILRLACSQSEAKPPSCPSLHPWQKADCVKRVKRLGDLLGRDRIRITTVAFGPATEDFQVLQVASSIAHAPPPHDVRHTSPQHCRSTSTVACDLHYLSRCACAASPP